MKKRSLVMVMVLVFSSPFVLAQQPRPLPRRPVERQLAKRNVTIIDIRTAKPLVAHVQAARDTRAAVKPPGAGRVVAQALSVAQVRTTFLEAGLKDIVPAGEYARFGPTQLNVEGKGYLMLQAPLWVTPSDIDFDGTFDQNQWIHIVSGPKVRLSEAGAFVLDFLVDFPDADLRQTFRCDVIKDEDVFQQIECSRDSTGPQHILVVFQQGTPTPPLVNPWIGICLHNSGYQSGLDWIRWYLYQVVVTKL